ncbi:transcription termination factor mtef1, partial [Quercus suber]
MHQKHTIHFLSTTTTKPHFLSSLHHHDYSQRNLHFPPIFSLKATTTTTTLSLPLKPPKTPEIPNISPPSQTHSHSHFQEKMLYLDSIGLDFLSLINHHPPIISASLPDLKSTVDLITSTLSLTSVEFRRIINMCPEILTSRVTDIVPIFTFLLREARVNGSDLKRVINRRPRLLVCSVQLRLRPTLYFLQSIGISEVHRHSYLLSCSVEDKLIPRIEYFEKIGFSRRDATSEEQFCDRLEVCCNSSIPFRHSPLWCTNCDTIIQSNIIDVEDKLIPRIEYFEKIGFSRRDATSEEQFCDRLEVCCNSSIPFRHSPLWCTNCDTIIQSNIIEGGGKGFKGIGG